MSVIKNDVLKLMGMDADSIIIERAHRSPGGPPPQNGTKPRPIHVRFLRFGDRDKILRSAPSLKGKTINGKQIYITDDVTYSVRESRKKLRQKLPEIRKRREVKYAYVPWSVPASLVIVKMDGTTQKINN